MARSNLVSVGSIVNPFESLQRAAQNVSNTYGNIAEKEASAEKTRQEQARLEKQRVDNRFDKAQQLDLQRQQQAASDLDRKNRFDLLTKQEARAAQTFEEGVTDRQTARDRQETLDRNKDILGSTKINIGFEDLGSSVKDKYTEQKAAIDKVEGDISRDISDLLLRRNFIDNNGKLSEAGQAEYDKRVAAYSKELAPAQAEDLAMQDITAARDAALASDYDKQAINFLSSSRSGLETAKTKAAQAPTVDEYVNAGINQLAAADYKNPEEARAALNERAKSLGLRTKADYSASDIAAEEKAYNRAKDKIGFLKDYYSLSNTKARSSGSTYKGMGTKEWNSFVDGVDLVSTSDKENINSLFAAAREANPSLPVGVIREAIATTAIKGLFSDNRALDAANPENIKKVSEVAQSLGTGSPSSGAKVTQNDLSKFEINLAPSSSSLSNRLRLPNRDVTLPTLDRLPFSSTEDLRKRVAAADKNSKKDLKDIPEITDSVSSILSRLPELTNTRILGTPGYMTANTALTPEQQLRRSALNTERNVSSTLEDIASTRRILDEEQRLSNSPSLVRTYNKRLKDLETSLASENKKLNQLKQQLLPRQ